jgi:RimJ/RimL family protein N-acetyltransferase
VPGGFPFPEELRTGRLIARRMRESDLEPLTRMHADAAVMATLGGVRTAEETRAFLARHLEHWDRERFGLWTLIDPADGGFIGRGGLVSVEVEGREEVELAYALCQPWWGRGLATELAVAGVAAGFELLHLPGLVCLTLPTNAASRRVMEKAGFLYQWDVVHRGLLHRLCRLTARRWLRLRRSAGGV